MQCYQNRTRSNSWTEKIKTGPDSLSGLVRLKYRVCYWTVKNRKNDQIFPDHLKKKIKLVVVGSFFALNESVIENGLLLAS